MFAATNDIFDRDERLRDTKGKKRRNETPKKYYCNIVLYLALRVPATGPTDLRQAAGIPGHKHDRQGRGNHHSARTSALHRALVRSGNATTNLRSGRTADLR